MVLSSCRFVEVNPTEAEGVITQSADSVAGNVETADRTGVEGANGEIPNPEDGTGNAVEREASDGENSDVIEPEDGISDVADPSGANEINNTTAETEIPEDETGTVGSEEMGTFSYDSMPAYSGQPYVIMNGNQPYFTEADMVTTPFEYYSDLDFLGRCGVAYANICIEIMPTEDRGAIGMIRPSGWQTVKYDFIDGKYLYNRCHLIGYQLAGENANEKNLITGTRYLNVVGMLPFENQVANYVTRTDNHVLYRVTPIYVENNLVAQGVLMEAKSVEDAGEGICFNVFCYNVQPGVVINYSDGSNYSDGTLENAVPVDSLSSSESTPDTSAGDMTQSTDDSSNESTSQSAGVASDGSSSQSATTTDAGNTTITYVLNTNTGKFHYPTCSSVDDMSPRNRQDVDWTRDECINAGYEPCGRCHP
ncbi:MAG: DNA/RNA non-specific endonuclease [Lachnospiraceae bacterium]